MIAYVREQFAFFLVRDLQIPTTVFLSWRKTICPDICPKSSFLSNGNLDIWFPCQQEPPRGYMVMQVVVKGRGKVKATLPAAGWLMEPSLSSLAEEGHSSYTYTLPTRTNKQANANIPKAK